MYNVIIICKLTQSWSTCGQLWELVGRAARSARLVQAARHPPPFLRLGGSRQHPSCHFQPPLSVIGHYDHQSQSYQPNSELGSAFLVLE